MAMKVARPDCAHDAPRFGVWTYEYVTTTQGMSADGQPMTWYGDLEDTAIGLESQGEYLRDVPIGPWTFWHPNGRVRARGSFMAGEMSGPWWFFFDDGSVDATNTGVYQHDELTSPAAK